MNFAKFLRTPFLTEHLWATVSTYYLLSQRFVYLMTVKLPGVRNLHEEITAEWDCIVSENTCFQQFFMGTEKKCKEIFRL